MCVGNPDITKNFRVIAYDLPRHGKSDPPANQEWWNHEYRLTTDHFVNFIVAVLAYERDALPVFLVEHLVRGIVHVHLYVSAGHRGEYARRVRCCISGSAATARA
jgi:hypothetical protein